MDTISIRKAYESDIPLIRDLAFRIWPDTYSRIISKDQIDYMLGMMYSEAALMEQMQSGIEFIIAYDGAEPVGFAGVGLMEADIYKLHKLYILPSQQGRGTGRVLVNAVEKAVQGKQGTALRLNVNKHNPAIGFYEKIGFLKICDEVLDIGNGYVMDDYVMEKSPL